MSFNVTSPYSSSSVGNSFPTEEPAKLRRLNLADDDVHVWRVPLNQYTERVPGWRQVLSVDERMRADRFHFEKDRNQFIESRAALRFILGEYLNIVPQQVRFAYGTHGK